MEPTVANVATTTSFATRPVIEATAGAHESPKPRGTKMYLNALPILASIESSIASPKNSSLKLKLCKNKSVKQVIKITVPALMIKLLLFSHM